jgi:hypothetical protein
MIRFTPGLAGGFIDVFFEFKNQTDCRGDVQRGETEAGDNQPAP